jgi:hypothetical protein
MPVGRVDYRERLRGPGTQDVLGMILRGMAGGSGASADVALDPEGAQAVKDMFGGGSTSAAPAPRPLRPDEQAAIADRKAREAYQRIVGGPQSLMGGPGGEVRSDLPIPASKPPGSMAMSEIGPANMAVRERKPVEPKLAPASGKAFSARISERLASASRNIQDTRAETGAIDTEFKRIASFIEQDAALDLGPELAKGVALQMFPEAISPSERLEWARRVAWEITAARKAGYSYWQGGMESGAGARGY